MKVYDLNIDGKHVASFYECEECSALVMTAYQMANHEDWHKRLNQLPNSGIKARMS